MIPQGRDRAPLPLPLPVPLPVPLKDRLRWLAGRVARQRVVQLFALGLAIFLVTPPGPESRRISLDAGRLDALKAAQARRQGRPRLDEAGAREVEVLAAEDEVLYREALRLGLDRSDDVVRRRLVQKMLFVAEDLGGASRPATDDELRRYYEAHADDYRQGERRRFVHVFARTEAAAQALVGAASQLDATAPPPLGEAFPLARDVTLDQPGLAALYGEAFAAAVFAQPAGRWSGVVPSKYGFHLVRILERTPGGVAPLEAVIGRVRLDERNDRRQRAVAAFVRRAAARYRVELAGVPWTPAATAGPGRVAIGVRAEEEKGD